MELTLTLTDDTLKQIKLLLAFLRYENKIMERLSYSIYYRLSEEGIKVERFTDRVFYVIVDAEDEDKEKEELEKKLIKSLAVVTNWLDENIVYRLNDILRESGFKLQREDVEVGWRPGIAYVIIKPLQELLKAITGERNVRIIEVEFWSSGKIVINGPSTTILYNYF